MLLKALRSYINPAVISTPQKPDVNLLNQILYGQFTASTLVVWYDSNQQTFIDKVIIHHEHPDWGYGGRDVIHSLNSQHDKYDRDIFFRRQKNNFNL